MTVDQLNFNNMKDLMGTISTLTTRDTADDCMLELDGNSKRKLAQLLKKGVVTADIQELLIDSLTVKKPGNELLTRGQSPWIKTSTGYAITTQTQVFPRFSANLQAVTTTIHDSEEYYAIEITLGNFSFNFRYSNETVSGDYVIYSNVMLTVYPSNYTIKILE